MQTILIIFLIILTISLLIGVFLLFQKLQSLTSKNSEQELENMVNKVFGLTANSLAEQSTQVLQGEKKIIQTDLANKHDSIRQIVTELKQEIDKRQQEIRQLEKDRNTVFVEIREAINNHQQITKELQTSTSSLANILSNNQNRGEWGERILEDILINTGLIKGIHYLQQAQLQGSADRPDFKLLLPNQRSVPIDVKFPFQEIKNLSESSNKTQQALHVKQFEKTISSQIKKVATYIRPEKETVDYAIMFVPNEMLFSFINQKMPDVVNQAMKQHVLIVSPFTFIIVARTILESYRTFTIENNLRKFVQVIGEFEKEWGRFITEFDKFGDNIYKMEDAFKQIRDTRHRQLSKRMDEINSISQTQEQILLTEEIA